MTVDPLRSDPSIRDATPDDADDLARLIDIAGEGLPQFLWSQSCGPDQSVWDIGRQRAQRESGGFSYRNAVIIATEAMPCAGALIGYGTAEDSEPVPPDIPAMVRPLIELESVASGSWYINAVAVYPEARGRGLGSVLIERAETTAADAGFRVMSLIVSDTNVAAGRLYDRHGYREVETRAMIKEGWRNEGENWILLTKRL